MDVAMVDVAVIGVCVAVGVVMDLCSVIFVNAFDFKFIKLCQHLTIMGRYMSLHHQFGATHFETRCHHTYSDAIYVK